MISYTRMRVAAKASAIHLLAGLVVAGLVTALVFWLWFPGAYLHISGGIGILMLLVGVDAVCGPLLTFVIYDQRKNRHELFCDLSLVLVIQVAALIYGLTALFAARPVHLVFEYNRLAVVSAADVDKSTLIQAPANMQMLPVTGPTLLSLRPFKDANEEYDSTMAALSGVPQAAQPALWQSWSAAHTDILRESRSVTELKKRFGAQAALIDRSIAVTDRPVEGLRYLPLLARKKGWTVLIDVETTVPVGFLPLDSF